MRFFTIAANVLSAALLLSGVGARADDHEPVVVMVDLEDDARAITESLKRALPIKRRFVTMASGEWLIVGPYAPIEFRLPASTDHQRLNALEQTITAIVRGERLGADLPYFLFRDYPTVITRPPIIPNLGVPILKQAMNERFRGTPPAAIPLRTWGELPGGIAPDHNPYALMLWNASRDLNANVDRAWSSARDRGLLTEPGYAEILADDRLIPLVDRARFVEAFEARLANAAADFGWPRKTAIWRSRDSRAFDAALAARQRHLCATLLEKP